MSIFDHRGELERQMDDVAARTRMANDYSLFSALESLRQTSLGQFDPSTVRLLMECVIRLEKRVKELEAP